MTRPAEAPGARPAHRDVEQSMLSELVEKVGALEATVAHLAAIIGERLEAQPGPRHLVDAPTLAGHLGVSTAYVYRHADELGAVAIGGARGRGRPLRFDLAAAIGREPSDQSQAAGSPANTGRKRRRRSSDNGNAGGLLPLLAPEVPR